MDEPSLPNAVLSDNERNVGLSLSGGGFRATLFHLGVLRRLNEFGILSQLSAITSVSGGSILNGILAKAWNEMPKDHRGIFGRFDELIADPTRQFCRKDIRTAVLIGTRLNPLNWASLTRDWFSVSARFLAKAYSQLYQDIRLCDLPAPSESSPRFIFCTTNVRSGGCWQLHCGPEGRMGDFYSGYCRAGDVRLADAVAASSAFTPGFSALRLVVDRNTVFDRVDPWGRERTISSKRGQQSFPDPLLTDGGVYDNLGVQPLWGKYSILASDAGAPFTSVRSNSQFILTRLKRAIDIGLDQVGAVRKRWLVDELASGRQFGALWSIHTIIDEFGLANAPGYLTDVRDLLANVRTDLNSFTDGEIACLENHGYSITDAAIRSRVPSLIQEHHDNFIWPYPEWMPEAKAIDALRHSDRRHVARDAVTYMLFGHRRPRK